MPTDVDRRRFVVFASNHDQVGNRAIGDRPATSLSSGAQAMSLALVLLGPFTPMLFMGEEYGETRPFMFFTDHDEPLGSAVSEGRMGEFAGHGWEDLYGGDVHVPDPQDRTTFLRSKLGSGIGSSSAGNDAIRDWVAALIALRPRVADPEAWSVHPAGVSESSPRVLTMHGPLTVHANLTDAAITVPGTEQGTAPAAVFGDVTATGDGELRLAPDAVVIVRAG